MLYLLKCFCISHTLKEEYRHLFRFFKCHSQGIKKSIQVFFKCHSRGTQTFIQVFFSVIHGEYKHLFRFYKSFKTHVIHLNDTIHFSGRNSMIIHMSVNPPYSRRSHMHIHLVIFQIFYQLKLILIVNHAYYMYLCLHLLLNFS